MARTWAVVTPCSRQWGPPELLATLPPMVHDCWLEGSGAKWSPWPATARDRSRLRTPGWTHATRRLRVDREDLVHLGRDDDDRR